MLNFFKKKFQTPDWITSFDVEELRKTLPDFDELVVEAPRIPL